MLYSESIAGRDVAILISWLGTVGPVNCFNKVFYNDFLILIGRVQTTLGYAPEMRHSTNIQDFRSLLA